MINHLCFVKLFIILVFYKNVESESRIDPLVQTNVGLIRGVRVEDGDYAKFLGVPYAKVNESNPFGASLPYPKFENVFDANNDSAECPQVYRNFGDLGIIASGAVSTLDCLHLNIFVPSTAHSQNLLPVLVFTHGGGFSGGSGSTAKFHPKYLIKNDIVFVSLNYRLGAYGFMCLGTPEVPGNQGLKDQLTAFRWIKENIQAFGGDPNKITVSGQSAGAMSTDFQLYSAPEKAFNQIILQSGTSLIPEAPLLPDPMQAIELAGLLGFNTTDDIQAISFLSTVDPNLLVEAVANMDRFLTCVEKEIEGVEAFLTDFPINLDIPKAKDMSIMIGFNSLEKKGTDIRDELKWNFNFNDQDLDEMTAIVQHFYIGDEEYDVNKLAEFDSDKSFNYPADRSVTKYVENGALRVFYYLFSYTGGQQQGPFRNTVTPGAAHGAEMEFLYYSDTTSNRTAEQELLSDRMCKMWTNFVKYGDPTPEITELLPVKWEPVVQGSPKYFMNISATLQVSKRPFHQRMSFWDLFFNRNAKYERGYREPENRISDVSTRSDAEVLQHIALFYCLTFAVISIIS